MYLTYDALGVTSVTEYDFKIDLTGIIENDDQVTDVNTLYTSLVWRIAKWAAEKGVDYDEVFPLHIHDGQYWENGVEKLSVDEKEGWLKEVATFAWNVEQGPHIDSDQAYATINDVGWKWFDFDDFEDSINEDYHGEFDGDYDEFAREYESNYGESIPDRFYNHIDWEAYGRDLIEGYSEREWNNRTFLYVQ